MLILRLSTDITTGDEKFNTNSLRIVCELN